MNKYLRQLFTAVVALFVILGLSSTIIMAVRANALNNDPRNARSLYHQLGAYRGAILASDGTVMAKSNRSTTRSNTCAPIPTVRCMLRSPASSPSTRPPIAAWKPPAACCSTVRPIH